MLQTVRNRDYSCISTFKGELIANGNSLCKTEIASHRWVLSSGQSICSSGVVPCYLDNDNAVPIIVLCAICRTLKHVKTSYTSMPGMAMLRHQLSIRLLQSADWHITAHLWHGPKTNLEWLGGHGLAPGRSSLHGSSLLVRDLMVGCAHVMWANRQGRDMQRTGTPPRLLCVFPPSPSLTNSKLSAKSSS